MKIKPIPPQKLLQTVLDYNSKTGVFIWKYRDDQSSRWNGKFARTVAGTKTKKNIIIVVNWIPYPAHRLAWVYEHGNILTNEIQIDHKNNNPHDNRLINLREATHSENCSNARKWNKKELPKGVSKQSKSSSYRVRIQVRKKVIYIGTFNTIGTAYKTYCEAVKKYHGQFARIA